MKIEIKNNWGFIRKSFEMDFVEDYGQPVARSEDGWEREKIASRTKRNTNDVDEGLVDDSIVMATVSSVEGSAHGKEGSESYRVTLPRSLGLSALSLPRPSPGARSIQQPVGTAKSSGQGTLT